jgi:hypothetical protein
MLQSYLAVSTYKCQLVEELATQFKIQDYVQWCHYRPEAENMQSILQSKQLQHGIIDKALHSLNLSFLDSFSCLLFCLLLTCFFVT